MNEQTTSQPTTYSRRAMLLGAGINLYSLAVCIWAVIRLIYGDEWAWLFLVNSFALYLFLPLPLILLIAFTVRRTVMWGWLITVMLIGGYLFGGLLLPKAPPATESDLSLTVMTSNALRANRQTPDTIAALRAESADIVGIQELNVALATAIETELSDIYPHQILAPVAEAPLGMGVISRYPLQPTSIELIGYWVGDPQVLRVELDGVTATVVNFHAAPPGSPTALADMAWRTRIREGQAVQLAELVRSQPNVILLGDLNATDVSVAYSIISGVAVDAWRSAGWGLGHTFPGGEPHGLGFMHGNGIPIPMWLVRIDYIFHAPTWQTERAWIGAWDGHADHRPVVARLTYRGEIVEADGAAIGQQGRPSAD